ncbi:MAG: GntR family transcriptional regulator [Candidatus Nanopelagicales bacterium]
MPPVTEAEIVAPLVEQAVERLREDLVSLSLPPGTKLKVEFLRNRYGFSSSPLREALNRLTQEGLVVADQRRGFRVAPMSIEDFGDITRMRLLLDLSALEDSIEHGGDDWEVAAISAFYRLEKVEARLTDGPVVLNNEWSRLHKEFHMALISASPSSRLLKISSELFDQAERYRRFTAKSRTESRSKSDEHKAILDATIRRDRKAAGALLRGHISRTYDNLITVLEGADYSHLRLAR